MNLKVSIGIIQAMLDVPGYRFRLLKVWLIVLFLFLWLPRINLLAYIFFEAPISFGAKLAYVFKDFGQLITSISNPVILSMFIFSFLTALSIVLLVFMVRTGRLLQVKSNSQKKAYSGVGVAAIGSHILSCGGTLLLAPLFPALIGSNEFLGSRGANINLWLATSANLIGIALVIFAISRTGSHIAKMVNTTSSRSYG